MTVDQPSVPPQQLPVSIQDEMRTIGGLWFNGSCQMMDEYGSAGANEFLNWTIFGDPSVRVRTASPTSFAGTTVLPSSRTST